MKRTICSILSIMIVALSVAFSSMSSLASVAIRNEDKANELKALGMFQGTDKGFELGRSASRIEGLVMLIRMLGKEEEALASTKSHPFTDVPQWASSYVSFAYGEGLTKGVSETLFGTSQTVTASQYFTFVLRALGYNDQMGDFAWDQSADKALEIGLIGNEDQQRYESDTSPFLRDDCVGISYDAMQINRKGEEISLLESLIEVGAIEREAAEVLGLIEARRDVNYVYLPITSEDNTNYYVSSEVLIKAFPTVNRIEMANGLFEIVRDSYRYLITQPETTNQISENEPNAITIRKEFTTLGESHLFIYDRDYNILGYAKFTEKIKNSDEMIIVALQSPFDEKNIRNEVEELLRLRGSQCVYFDPAAIDRSQAFNAEESSAEFELKVGLLPASMQTAQYYGQGWSTAGYSSEEIDRSIKFYTIYINDKIASGTGYIPTLPLVRLSTVPGRTNFVILADQDGNMLGYTMID